MKCTINRNIVKNNYYCNDITINDLLRPRLASVFFFFNLQGTIYNKFRTKSPEIKSLILKKSDKRSYYIIYGWIKSSKILVSFTFICMLASFVLLTITY